MNASELAQMMLLWEQKRVELDLLEAEIKTAVLTMGKTQTVGNVRATFSQGRKTYDYEAAVKARGLNEASPMVLSHATLKHDWRAVADELALTDIPYTQGEPSVAVKLVA